MRIASGGVCACQNGVQERLPLCLRAYPGKCDHLTSSQRILEGWLVSTQSLCYRQGHGLGLTSRAAARYRGPYVVLVQALCRLESPNGRLPIVNSAECVAQWLAVDKDLARSLNDVGTSDGGLPLSGRHSSTELVHGDGLGLVQVVVDIALESLEALGDLLGHEIRVDLVEALDQTQARCVVLSLDLFTRCQAVLLPRPPGHGRDLLLGQGR